MNEINNIINSVETDLKNFNSNVTQSVSTITTVSKKSIEYSLKAVDRMATICTIAGIIMGVFVAGLSIVGFGELRSIKGEFENEFSKTR